MRISDWSSDVCSSDLVLENLNVASKNLPAGVAPAPGPDASGVGWVYQYVLKSDRHSLDELRAMQDWYLRYQLTTPPGVAEVASVGGQIGRASCRERVCKSGWISVVAVTLKKKYKSS